MGDFKILIDKDSIARRVKQLASEIGEFCRHKEGEFLFLWLKDGADVFAANLISELGFSPVSLGVKVSSYGDAQSSSGIIEISDDIKKARARKVLLIDDVLDTGKTASAVSERLKQLGVCEIKTCFLLEKQRRDRGGFTADFVGFKIPDLFVFGYGLDLQGGLREIPHICVAQ